MEQQKIHRRLSVAGIIDLSQNVKQQTFSTLSIIDSKFSAAAGQSLSNAIKKNLSLKEISINECNISRDIIKLLLDFLKLTKHIQILQLMDNNIDDVGFLHLSKILKSNLSLVTLLLDCNDFGHEPSHFNSFSEFLSTSTTLTYLSLSSNQIDDSCAGLLADGMAKNESLKTLILSNNVISDHGVDKLVQAFNLNTTITKFDFSYNKPSPQGGLSLLDLLLNNNSLRKVNFCNCSIDDEANELLKNILMVNRTLKHLDLSSNSLGIESSQSIGEGLAHNTTLTKLNISDNILPSIDHILLSLNTNRSLRKLNASFNESFHGNVFLNMLKTNNTLTSLEIVLLTMEGRRDYADYVGELMQNSTLTTLYWHDNKSSIIPPIERNNEAVLSTYTKKIYSLSDIIFLSRCDPSVISTWRFQGRWSFVTQNKLEIKRHLELAILKMKVEVLSKIVERLNSGINLPNMVLEILATFISFRQGHLDLYLDCLPAFNYHKDQRCIRYK